MRPFFLLVALIILNLNLPGQDFYHSYKLKYFSSEGDTSAYTTLLERFIRSDSTLVLEDFIDLYYGAVFLHAYNPSEINAAEEEIRQLNFGKNFQQAYTKSDSLLRKYPMSIQGYFEKSWACHNLDKLEEEEYCRKRYKVLIRAILSSGDGASLESAYYANLPNDEFEVIKYLRLEIKEEKEISYIGNIFDVFTLKANKAKIKELYFNVNIQKR